MTVHYTDDSAAVKTISNKDGIVVTARTMSHRAAETLTALMDDSDTVIVVTGK